MPREVSAEVTELLALLNTGDEWDSRLRPDGMYRVRYWPRGVREPRVAERSTFDAAVREAVGAPIPPPTRTPEAA